MAILTVLVVMGNVTDEEPAGTVTVAGTVATEVLLEVRLITAPAPDADPVNLTVPVEDDPPLMLLGLIDREVSDKGVTVNGAVRVLLYPAEIVTVVALLTVLVLIVNDAALAPAGTVTLESTVAVFVSLLDSDTTAPPGGATPFKVTVPVDVVPPVTLVGFNNIEDSVRGLTVKIVDCVPV